jgi:pimeloyl-ACP methyl ester carboxylesterase
MIGVHIPNRSQLSDLRGVARTAIDATDAIAEVVEKMHRTIQLRPGPLGVSATDRPTGITGLVYRCVRGGVRLVGRAVDASLSGVTILLPEGESSPAFDAYRSVANGVYGDYLFRTGNPLAIDMSLRHHGRRVDIHDPSSVFDKHSDVSPGNKLLVLVHGLCMNDQQWSRDGHDHGAALANELGYLPLYLRYNSGLPIASNGRLLAEMLETLIGNWATPLHEVVIMGHSMGGLVARSACYHAHQAGHGWPEHLRKLVFLGTPHHGAPLERGGHGLDLVMNLSPYSMPFTRLSKARSAGITDLRYGTISAGKDIVPLPSGVKCYALAAVRAAKRSLLSARLIGDGLVTLDSALGRHRDRARMLAIPRTRQWVGYGMGHRELLSRPEAYRQISAWLQEPA